MTIKVLHVLCDFAGGGAERLVLDLCTHSSEEVKVAAAGVFDGGELLPSFREHGVDVRAAGRRVAWWNRPTRDVRAFGRLRSWAMESDLIHTHLWAGDVWGRLVGQFAGKTPVVSTEHNTRADSRIRQNIWLRTVNLSDVVVCVSEAARQRLVRAGVDPQRIRVIHNGISLRRFPGRVRASGVPLAEPVRLLGMGRLTRQKGFDVLIRAASRLDNVKVDIVGEGPDRGYLDELISTLGAPVQIHEWSSTPWNWYSQADLMVIPSRWEGFGLVGAEAMASGCPIVASNIAGLNEILGDACAWFESEDSDGLATTVRQLVPNVDRLDAMVEAGSRRVAQFDVVTTTRKYEALYREILDARV